MKRKTRIPALRILSAGIPLAFAAMVLLWKVSPAQDPAPRTDTGAVSTQTVVQNDSETPVQSTARERISESHKLAGLLVVAATAVFFFVFPLANQRLSPRNLITVYRQYELKMLQNGRLKLDDMFRYHALYHWGDYAAVASGMVLVAVILVIEASSALTAIDKIVQTVVVTAMTLSTVTLCWADLVHTNTQSPIIPLRRRFKLIDLSVTLGTAGTMFMVFAIIAYVALMSLTAVCVCAAAYCVAVVLVYRTRRIDKTEFFTYFKIHSPSLWTESERSDGTVRQSEGDALFSTGDGKTVGANDAEFIIEDPAATTVDDLDIPYVWAEDDRQKTYAALLAKVHDKPALSPVADQARLCLGISDREDSLIRRRIEFEKQTFQKLRKAAVDAGADAELRTLVEQIGMVTGCDR